MKSLFTIHAGEYLTGAYIEEKLSNNENSYNVWVPGRDAGAINHSNSFFKQCSLKCSQFPGPYPACGPCVVLCCRILT